MEVILSAIIVALMVGVVWQQINARRQSRLLQMQQYEIIKLNREVSEYELQIIEQRNRRKRLLAASTQALIVVERDYRVSSINKAAKQLFGPYNKNDTFIRWARHHELQELVDQVLKGIKTPPHYFTMRDRILVANARTIKEKQTRTIVAVALAIHDVTQLERLSRARRDFITNISHELRTPITSIRLLADTLLDGALDDPHMARKLTREIAVKIDSLSQLAQEVLDLSLIESGRAPLRLDNFNLQTLIQEQVEQIFPQAVHKNIELHVNVCDELYVLIDKSMINRVVANLLHNAIKFTESGNVTIGAGILAESTITPPSFDEDEEDWVLVSIQDTGVGILPDDLTRIFERFYTADQSRSGKSTGLGLAIAKHIVNAHGGQIWADSDGKCGTTIHFTLPVEN